MTKNAGIFVPSSVAATRKATIMKPMPIAVIAFMVS
jgi:hypothetical protein